MPADDLTLNVRQIAGYPPTASAPPAAELLIQLGGLGGPYASISPQALVSTALSTGGDMAIAGALAAQSVSGGSAAFSNAVINMFSAQKACIVDFAATYATVGGVTIATVNDLAAQYAASVNSFNGRVGNVSLWIDDIICAGGAPIYAPRFQGDPRACTPPPTSNSSRLATTAFVATAIGGITGEYAPIDSPNFTGVPTAPTPALGSSDGQLATTAFVQNAIASGVAGVASFNTRTGAVVLAAADLTAAGGALLASPAFTGSPAAPTAAPGTNTTQLATTAFVMAAVTGVVAGVSSFNSRTGAVTLNSTDLTGAGGALVASSVASFNGRTGSVNLIANDISGASGALLASPAFTGTPSAPTPPPGDSSTRLATTAFVGAQTGFAPIASPAFTGVPTAPTAAVATNTTQLATCAFVLSEIAGSTAGVATFNGRSGAVTLLANDLSSAGGALLASPALSGTPSAPTAAVGVSTTQLATCAFVAAAIAAQPGYLPLVGGTLSGPLTISGAAGATRSVYGATGANRRWEIRLGDAAAETGGNAGSFFGVAGYSDAGALLNVYLSIQRSDGQAFFFADPSAPGYQIEGGPGAYRAITATTNNSPRWTMSLADGTPETGGNTGSNFILGALSDGGVGTQNPLSIVRATGVATFSQPIVNGSDLRSKTDVEPVRDALTIVSRLQGVYYRSRAGLQQRDAYGARRHIGLIAQDVVVALPEVVFEAAPQDTDPKDGGPMLGVAYPNIVVVLIEAIKTLADRVAALEAA